MAEAESTGRLKETIKEASVARHRAPDLSRETTRTLPLATLLTLCVLLSTLLLLPWMGGWSIALVAAAGSFLGLELFTWRTFKRIEALRSAAEPDIKMLSKMEPLLDEIVQNGALQRVHQSIHHLFSNRDVLRPRGGGNVDMVLDAADLPSALTDYLEDVRAAGAKARILLLDPDSSLTERHRFVQQAGGDANAAVQRFRTKIQTAIEELGPLATIRLFDALPPGNLIIVDDHIFWGGVPSLPSDASFPIIGITADTREQVYWAFRRNFDVLWKQAKPVTPPKPAASHLTAASL